MRRSRRDPFANPPEESRIAARRRGQRCGVPTYRGESGGDRDGPNHRTGLPSDRRDANRSPRTVETSQYENLFNWRRIYCSPCYARTMKCSLRKSAFSMKISSKSSLCSSNASSLNSPISSPMSSGSISVSSCGGFPFAFAGERPLAGEVFDEVPVKSNVHAFVDWLESVCGVLNVRG